MPKLSSVQIFCSPHKIQRLNNHHLDITKLWPVEIRTAVHDCDECCHSVWT